MKLEHCSILHLMVRHQHSPKYQRIWKFSFLKYYVITGDTWIDPKRLWNHVFGSRGKLNGINWNLMGANLWQQIHVIKFTQTHLVHPVTQSKYPELVIWTSRFSKLVISMLVSSLEVQSQSILLAENIDSSTTGFM